jgi:hypothetical protein
LVATEQSYTSYRVLAHEFGHVCAGVRRMDAVRSLNSDAFQLASDLGDPRTPAGDTPRCRTQSGQARFYGELGSELKMAPATLECLKSMSSHSSSTRFVSGSCPWGCQNDQLEEAFADWVHFHTVPDELWVPALVPDFCTFKRDGSHGLPADELDCFLRTPEFKTHAESVLGCQGAG